jgi:hypothetical protein
VQNALATIP